MAVTSKMNLSLGKLRRVEMEFDKRIKDAKKFGTKKFDSLYDRLVSSSIEMEKALCLQETQLSMLRI